MTKLHPNIQIRWDKLHGYIFAGRCVLTNERFRINASRRTLTGFFTDNDLLRPILGEDDNLTEEQLLSLELCISPLNISEVFPNDGNLGTSND